MFTKFSGPPVLSGVLATLAALLPAASVAQGQGQGPPPATVTVARVAAGNVSGTVAATGTVVSRNDARLAAEVSGRLDWVAEPGARVTKGAALARVDTRTLELQLRENEAQLARLGANVELLYSQLARLNALPPGIASQSQLDEAAARVSMARHEHEQTAATRDRTRHLIDRAVIRAPFPGHVVERIRQLGEFVSAGTEVLRLTDTGNVEIVARAPVGEASHLAVGQAVMVRGTSKQAEEQDPRDRAGRRRAFAHARGARGNPGRGMADWVRGARRASGRAKRERRTRCAA